MKKTGSILILSPWPSIFSMSGGGTPLASDLLETLLAAGYTVDFVAPRHEDADSFPMHSRLRVHRYGPLRVVIKGYPGRWVAWLERTIRLTACALGVAIRYGRPRVVYGFSSLTIPAAVCSGLLLRRPTIGALFGTFLHPHLGRTRGLLNHFEEAIAFKTPVDRLIILNDGTRGYEVARALGVPEPRIRFWMHGLDLESCRAAMEADGRSELGLPSSVPLVVSASRLAFWKHVDRILRAAPDVLEAKPDTLFAVSGDGPERQALETLVQELSIAHAVRFLGVLPRDVNLRLIASADVFCSLYDYSNVGVALLEALGCGVAVVVADTGATREVVEDGANGLVVSPDDTSGTAAAIIRLVNEPDLRLRLGREARRRAEDSFLTPEQRASLELETIDELLARGDKEKPRTTFP
ncbi:MAG: glycosyltransferase family 4 protein [Actinomycetota bacterium]|nr:glycosyltransferase family 4 protein [Actinomycetota bacterium]